MANHGDESRPDHPLEEMAEIIARVRSLPPLPDSVRRLLELDIADPDLLEKAAPIIAADGALAAQVLRMANSAAFPAKSPVQTIDRAILRIGVRMVVGTALHLPLQRVFDPYSRLGHALWSAALHEAAFAWALASRPEVEVGFAPESAWTYGLLHDAGHLIMALVYGERFAAVLNQPCRADELTALERRAFGVDHQLTGRALCNHWSLPSDLTQIVACHHMRAEEREGTSAAAGQGIALVALADTFRRAATDPRTPAEAETRAALSEWVRLAAGMPEAALLGAAGPTLHAAAQAALGAVATHGTLLGVGVAG